MNTPRKLTKLKHEKLYEFLINKAAQGVDLNDIPTDIAREFHVGTIKREILVKAAEMTFDEWYAMIEQYRRKTRLAYDIKDILGDDAEVPGHERRLSQRKFDLLVIIEQNKMTEAIIANQQRINALKDEKERLTREYYEAVDAVSEKMRAVESENSELRKAFGVYKQELMERFCSQGKVAK